MHNIEMWTKQPKQAYVQAERRLDRDVFIVDVPPEFNRKYEKILHLLSTYLWILLVWGPPACNR